MADLKSFFAENAIKADNVKYVASQRFTEKDKPIEWELRVVSNDDIEKMRKSCTRSKFNPKTKEYNTSFDSAQFNNAMVCASVVFPDLNDAALQDSYGVIGAEELIRKMLTPGEYTDLIAAVSETCGFQSDMADKIKTAKN